MKRQACWSWNRHDGGCGTVAAVAQKKRFPKISSMRGDGESGCLENQEQLIFKTNMPQKEDEGYNYSPGGKGSRNDTIRESAHPDVWANRVRDALTEKSKKFINESTNCPKGRGGRRWLASGDVQTYRGVKAWPSGGRNQERSGGPWSRGLWKGYSNGKGYEEKKNDVHGKTAGFP